LHWPRYSLAGVTGALLFACVSFTPSLVPRAWYVQGVVAGISAAFGYGLAVFLAWLVHAIVGRQPSAALTRRLWILLACLGVPLLAWSLWLGQRWQRQIHALTRVPGPDSYAWVRILLLGLLTLAVIIAVVRALRRLVRWVAGWLVLLLPARLAGPLAAILVVTVIIGLNNELLWRGMVTAANFGFGAVNGTTNPGTFRPVAPERSGSPSSLISWESLGRQGRDFVALAPSVRELSAFSGHHAQTPVRIYAGLKSAPTIRSEAALAVRDLRRAGGFDRAVLLVATTTGTGLVDPASAETLEYMYNGNTATVALQYSYLPSWISFLVDHKLAEEAGRELFNQVYDAWSKLPPGQRPKLLVTATSLGVQGSEAAFGGVADIRNRTDGVVWAGPTHSSTLHEMLVEQRDPGSPEWLPIYDEGRTVRFVSRPADLWRPATPWDRPRVVYLQYGSDAVVRWTPSLAFTKPAWLSEARAPDVSPDMVWIPVVTFWQVTADLPSTYAVPAGHGHRYSELYVNAWAAVAAPPGWTSEDTHRLRVQVRKDRIERERMLLDLSGAPGREGRASGSR
jgi:uncharacterized membrane protein